MAWPAGKIADNRKDMTIMSLIKKTGIITLWALLVLVTAVVTAAVKQRGADGPNR